jgi:hypothetical protein
MLLLAAANLLTNVKSAGQELFSSFRACGRERPGRVPDRAQLAASTMPVAWIRPPSLRQPAALDLGLPMSTLRDSPPIPGLTDFAVH